MLKIKISREQALEMLGLRMTVDRLSYLLMDENLEQKVVEEWDKAGYIMREEKEKNHLEEARTLRQYAVNNFKEKDTVSAEINSSLAFGHYEDEIARLNLEIIKLHGTISGGHGGETLNNIEAKVYIDGAFRYKGKAEVSELCCNGGLALSWWKEAYTKLVKAVEILKR